MHFSYSNIEYKKERYGPKLVVSGEICNHTGKDYHAVVFRLILYIKNFPAGNIAFIINGFTNGQTRVFEKTIEDLEFESVGRDICNYELVAESAY